MIIEVRTFTAWCCPFCQWEARFWRNPRAWEELDTENQRAIVSHWLSHETTTLSHRHLTLWPYVSVSSAWL